MKVGISCVGYGLGGVGGVQVYVRDLVQALERYDGSDNEYVCVFHPGDVPPPRPPRGRLSAVTLGWPFGGLPRHQPVRRLLRLAFDWPRSADSLSAQIDRLGLDVIHYPATRMNEWALKTPVVLTFFDMQEAFLPKFFPFRERMARSVAHRRGVRKAEVVIAPSEFTAASLRSRYGTPRRKIHCIPAGVREAFHPGEVPGERERVAERYGIPIEGFLLYPANPWPHKNHERLLAALRRLSGMWGSAVPLVCTGRLAGERRSVLQMAKAVGLGSQVHDLGFVPEADIPALYRSARLMVFPSLFEGFGMPVLEAMASGCPVACSAATSLPEVGADAVRYFDPTDEAGMVEAMAELWKDERQRASLRERGLERVRKFRWNRVLPSILEAYSCAASAKRRGGLE